MKLQPRALHRRSLLEGTSQIQIGRFVWRFAVAVTRKAGGHYVIELTIEKRLHGAGVLTHPAGSMFPHRRVIIRPTLNVTYYKLISQKWMGADCKTVALAVHSTIEAHAGPRSRRVVAGPVPWSSPRRVCHVFVNKKVPPSPLNVATCSKMHTSI